MRHPDLTPMSDELYALRAEFERLKAELDSLQKNLYAMQTSAIDLAKKNAELEKLCAMSAECEDRDKARIALLESALREVMESHEAPYPPFFVGALEQGRWSIRRSASLASARALLEPKP